MCGNVLLQQCGLVWTAKLSLKVNADRRYDLRRLNFTLFFLQQTKTNDKGGNSNIALIYQSTTFNTEQRSAEVRVLTALCRRVTGK